MMKTFTVTAPGNSFSGYMNTMHNIRQTAEFIVRVLREKGFLAYFVGGCVRDMIMQNPVEDYDIATNALPDQIRVIFSRTLPVGEQFGVILVIIDDIQFEVATFRKDLAYIDGRHPEGVVFSNEKEDALRRDFTINGLFYDPFSDLIIDYVDGRKDMERKIIRTIGNPYDRFEEDKLRLIRAVRFACHYQFAIEPETWKAIGHLAHKINQVSTERIRDELQKIVLCNHPDQGLELLDQSGLLAVFLPEVAAMKGVEQPQEFHPEGDVFKHTVLMLGLMENPNIELALSVVFHDAGKPSTFQVKDRIRFNGHDLTGSKIAASVLRRLRFPKKQIERVQEIIKDHMKFMHVKEMRDSTLKRFLGQETFPIQLELHKLDCLASHRDISNWEFCSGRLEAYEEEELRPERLVSGHDLINLGFKPGPLFSTILHFVEDQQLEGAVATKDEAISMVLATYSDQLEHDEK